MIDESRAHWRCAKEDLAVERNDLAMYMQVAASDATYLHRFNNWRHRSSITYRTQRHGDFSFNKTIVRVETLDQHQTRLTAPRPPEGQHDADEDPDP